MAEAARTSRRLENTSWDGDDENKRRALLCMYGLGWVGARYVLAGTRAPRDSLSFNETDSMIPIFILAQWGRAV